MCLCCCDTRKSILIYLIVSTSLAFIYGIVALSQFGSNTDIYEFLIIKLEALEKAKDLLNSYSRRMQYYPYTYTNPYSQTIKDLDLDKESLEEINKISLDDIEKKSYGMVKRLKGIENGLGVLIFVFTLIFLGAEITYLVFIRGIKEYQLMQTKWFNIFNIVRIVVYSLSIAFIFLSILYGCLLIGCLSQYITLVNVFDSCCSGIMIGMIYGYFSFWLFITLSCGFGKERTLFVEVGSEENPGVQAKYDVNGNAIVRAIVSVQPVIGVNAQIDMKPPNTFYQQVPPNNAINQQYQPQIQQQIQDKPADPNSGRNLNQNNG